MPPQRRAAVVAELRGDPSGAGRRFVIVAARFNELITERLVAGARNCLVRHGVAETDVDLVWVPGAWELPVAALRLGRSGRHAGIVAIGCVIRGETAHFEYVAGEAAAGLGDAARQTGVPIGLGVLTTEDEEQALARAGGVAGNKGWEAALAVLEMADLFGQLETHVAKP
jgi:6,7-dimethyl-8-ribityllumazine synthase